MTDSIGPNDLHVFFNAKVAAVQAATADAPPPSFTPAPPGCGFSQFWYVGVGDVITAVCALPDKQCLSDPLKTRLLKKMLTCLHHLSPRYSTDRCRLALFRQRSRYITPLLKKVSMDSADVRSFRPISSLSVMSELLERLVAKQLVEYLSSLYVTLLQHLNKDNIRFRGNRIRNGYHRTSTIAHSSFDAVRPRLHGDTSRVGSRKDRC